MLINVILGVRQKIELVVLVEDLGQVVLVPCYTPCRPGAVDKAPVPVNGDRGPGVPERGSIHSHTRLISRSFRVTQDYLTMETCKAEKQGKTY